jgi:hypothetical protein
MITVEPYRARLFASIRKWFWHYCLSRPLTNPGSLGDAAIEWLRSKGADAQESFELNT